MADTSNRHELLISEIVLKNFRKGASTVEFSREEFVTAAARLGLAVPKNLGDVIYSFRYRADLPEAVRKAAPRGMTWLIEPAGRGKYQFRASRVDRIEPNPHRDQTKIPDATPGLIAMYALSDEQSLLAKVRYNRLVDLFVGVTCYSLQSHLRSTAPGLGQVEVDEVYIGLDRTGAHFVLPVQAKAGRDKLGIVQIQQDLTLCAAKFPNLICRSVAAQFIAEDVIALFEFRPTEAGPKMIQERHYRLVDPSALSPDEIAAYRGLTDR